MTEHTRRAALAGAVGIFASVAGCVGTHAQDDGDADGPSGGAEPAETEPGDGPAPYPESPTTFDDDRWVETADGFGRYRPRAVGVESAFAVDNIRGQIPDEWDAESVGHVEPLSPLVTVVMEYQNLGNGPDDVPPIDTRTRLVLGDSGRVVDMADEVLLRPTDNSAGGVGEIPADRLVSPAEYSLHPQSGATAVVGAGETVVGWYASEIPDAGERDDLFPAMGSGGAPFDYPARWRGFSLQTEATDD